MEWNIHSMWSSSTGLGRHHACRNCLDHKPLLLLATALLSNRATESFQMEAGPPYDKQPIQIGLCSSNTVLIYFRSGVGHYQSVLIALAADLHTHKP